MYQAYKAALLAGVMLVPGTSFASERLPEGIAISELGDFSPSEIEARARTALLRGSFQGGLVEEGAGTVPGVTGITVLYMLMGGAAVPQDLTRTSNVVQ